jgi:hypothetical protein
VDDQILLTVVKRIIANNKSISKLAFLLASGLRKKVIRRNKHCAPQTISVIDQKLWLIYKFNWYRITGKYHLHIKYCFLANENNSRTDRFIKVLKNELIEVPN